MKIYSTFLLVFMLFMAIFSEAQNCDNLVRKEDNTFLMSCNDGEALLIKFLDEKNIKFWYDPTGEFKRENKSFSVVNEDFDSGFKVTADESGNSFGFSTQNLKVKVTKETLAVRIFDKNGDPVLEDSEKNAFTYDGTAKTTRKKLQEGEKILGLGQKTGKLDRRGKSYTMWNSDKPCYSTKEDPIYKSIPFFMSSKNYGIFLDNTYKTKFDFGKSHNNFLSFTAPDGPFIYYFFYGDSYKDIIKSYTDLTGKPIMPPKWGLGFSESRGLLTNEKLTRKVAKGYRKRDIPADIIFQDIDWVDGLQNFEWDEDSYDNPVQMISDLGKEGFKVIVSQDPVISESTEKQWKEANDNGYLALDKRTGEAYEMPWPWGGDAGLVDFTNPEVEDWWGKLQQKPIDQGIKGFWTDMGEPAWSNEEDKDRLNIQHYKGAHEEIHNVYGLEWDRIVTEQFEKRNPNQRIFQMTRSAFAGMQRYTFAWSGDSGNKEDVNNGWDKFANQIPIGLSAGMGGIPFWATDISGYCGQIKNYEEFAELYIRWLQFGVFNPISRVHHEGNNAVEPWKFGKNIEKIAKSSIELKYKLIPYIYTYAREAYDTGLPLMRAMFLEYPQDEETYTLDHQFMFGENILVAPVIEEGAESRQIYLPRGEWVDFNNPLITYEGKQYINYNVSLETIPILIKKGSIIPEMPVMPFIGAMENAPLILEIFPSKEDSNFMLYEDDGISNDYKKDQYEKTEIQVELTSNKLEVMLDPESRGYKTEKRNIWLKIHLDKEPEKVINKKELGQYSIKKLKEGRDSKFGLLGYAYNKKKHLLQIRIPDKKEKTKIIINRK